MKILVPIKRVLDPDNANKVKTSPDGSKVLGDGLEWKLNPYDEYAVETALRLNENAKTQEKLGETIVVSVGPKDASQNLRQALAMGAERGMLVAGDDDALDAAVVARVLHKAIEKEAPDVVLMGKQTVDGESSSCAAYLAELLGWPLVTSAQSIKTSDGGKSFEICREVDIGELNVQVKGPVIITVADRILSPTAVRNGVTPDDFIYPDAEGGRYATLKGIMAAKKKTIDETDAATLGINTSTFSRYVKFELPPARKGQTVIVESAEELVQKLRQEAKVI